ncbi:formate--tetrahydrofolate ligase [Thermosipho africanus Ob7]|jgi:formate--tetrahydrofolate ligase|uniref:Formate--tetrahydrofolate ligase n=1 Tax=Thermosipho africanus (strain TCF52B) TaxID=484019 RepID=FTHS_THEAB|nr:formate--tetrahydrofolate ligase [Thermosipho africanus]B7IG29.1 RecName: Full=Formate--tetrahydrofolate ligase; AltName: Full=Formyltetrahydrofolate synthetase; Short=FHS; Short=FTHFS [Thermosipho africanus TCF52B]ACJ75043.1 fhs formate--tetrahydrofolate ligase [Thermosipho africanus TCF52B]MDK2838826.1 formate--tetrahydrofolate ligase [Thermosipho sp. (in: thermotogales)]RDI92458.1 formate--tetrahydrofolate ligase [Thermosipho africanus Ob7]
MKTDIEIAREAKLEKITKIAEKIDISEEYVEPYGKYIAKVDLKIWEKVKNNKDGKLILVTAMTPTPAGEGKTTTSIGLSMALNRLGKKSIVTLREPSLGPVFGIKGGAAGGGYSQVLPMENINLHFTGDIHAVSAAHNLISAVIDAHIKFGNELGIDPTRIYWKRTIDMNDRALRNIVVGLGGSANGQPREDGFIITAASEIMAILCLAKDLKDLKERLSNIVVAQSYDKKLIKVKDLKIEGALAVLLKDAIKPNLVQTIENTPAFVHGGPFANIAHGTNSIIATKLALKLSDYVVTEAGFAADLGAEKFLDFVSPTAGYDVNAVVVVATIKALKYHGGVKKDELDNENVEAMLKGMENLRVHVENLKKYNVPVIVALNVFGSDTQRELDEFSKNCEIPHALVYAFEKGGEGAVDLANLVLENIKESQYKPLITSEMSLEEKIETLAKEIYRAGNVIYTDKAKSKLKFLRKHGYDTLPVIVAKTQSSISDDPKKINAPSGYTFTIRDFELSAGAGFIVALAGDIMRMPGLSKIPNAVNIDIDEEGNIIGLS